MNESLTQRLLARWPLLAVAAGLLAVVAILYGRGDRPPVVIKRERSEGNCAQRLQAALEKARPASLGLVGLDVTLRNTPAEAAQSFSEWLRQPDCRDAVPVEPIPAEGKALLARLLGPDAAAALDADRFGPFDAAHVRDALLDFAAADRLARDAKDDLGRATRLFDYVARSVSPSFDAASEPPQTAYEAHLFGRGTAEERAVLFANLLRQLRIDAVVLRPAGDGDRPARWWVGVLLEGGVFLFDPEAGLPVPAPGTVLAPPTFLPRPATWAEAVASPDLLSAYRREAGLSADPIDAAALAAPRVELIGPSSFWLTAMERLELALPEDRGVLLYDPLQDTASEPGLFRRVADAGGPAWGESAIAVWTYPADVRAARLGAPDAQRERLEQRQRPYLGLIEPNPKTQIIEPSRGLWSTRLDHMSGRAGESIVRYQLVRYQQARVTKPDGTPLDLADDSLNRQSADEAFYWTAHAQFDLGRYQDAATTLRDYLGRGGNRGDEATALLALCLAADGRTDAAAAEADKLPEDAPGAPRLRWLAGRWKAAPASASGGG